jgi:hypothetical protein
MYILKNPSTLHSSLLQEIRVLSLHPLDIWYDVCYSRSGNSKDDEMSVLQQEIDRNFPFGANGSS